MEEKEQQLEQQQQQEEKLQPLPIETPKQELETSQQQVEGTALNSQRKSINSEAIEQLSSSRKQEPDSEQQQTKNSQRSSIQVNEDNKASRGRGAIQQSQRHQAGPEQGIDWFNFETRIRKVIYEVVDPLTKKQFQSFDGIEEIKKSYVQLDFRHQETVAKLEKTNKKCEQLELHERRIKDLENEMVMVKGLARNENASMLERIDTISTRLKVAQQDVTAMGRFDEKIKKVQQQIMQVTDEYNVTVTERLKEVSAEFIKQVNELDTKQREHHRDLQEVLLKLDGVKDYTKKNESRFDKLQLFINELRETFEDTRLSMLRQQNLQTDQASYSARQTEMEERLREQIRHLEKQVSDFRNVSADQDHDLRKHIHALTQNRIEQIIFQNQQEMFERIFSIKNISLHRESSLKRKFTINEFQLQIQSNFRQWREVQLYKGRHDRMMQLDDESSQPRRQSLMPSLHTDSIDFSTDDQKGLAQVQEEVNENEILQNQQKLMMRTRDPEDEEQKRYIQDLQIIDQETMILGKEALAQGSDTLSKQHRKHSSVLSIPKPQITLDAKKSPIGTVQSSNRKESSSEDDQYSARPVPAKLPPFLKELNEDKLKSLIELSITPMRDNLTQFQFFLQETKTQMTHLQMKLSHEPLLKLIDKNSDLLATITADIKKLKEDSSKSSLSQTIQRIEVTQALQKNDIQQQIYKIKELNEQMYIKQIEMGQKMDYENIKTRKIVNEMGGNVEKNQIIIRQLENEGGNMRELIRNIAEGMCSLVELEAVTSALEQQDEVDRKQWMNEPLQANPENPQSMIIGYNPSVINFLGHPFKRQNLIYSRRVLIETFILQVLSAKAPFQEVIKKSGDTSNDAFRSRLILRLKKISDEFQDKLDKMALEIERQQKLQNPTVPKEVQRIKQQLIPENSSTGFKKNNLLTKQTGGGGLAVVKDSNQVVYHSTHSRNSLLHPHQTTGLIGNINSQAKNLDQLSHNQLLIHQRQTMNHSVLEGTQIESLLNRSSDTKVLLKPLNQRVNVGNVEYLPKEKQPIKGTQISYKNRSLTHQGRVVIPQQMRVPESPEKGTTTTEFPSPVGTTDPATLMVNTDKYHQFKAIEPKTADLLVLPSIHNQQQHAPNFVNLQIPQLIMSQSKNEGQNELSVDQLLIRQDSSLTGTMAHQSSRKLGPTRI